MRTEEFYILGGRATNAVNANTWGVEHGNTALDVGQEWKENKMDLISRQDLLDAIERDAYRHTYLDQITGIVKRMPSAQQWIPCSERLPSDEERKEWIDTHLDGIGYLYPCLVTRYSSINPEREAYNPYVAKHYFDGEDFVDNGEEVCSEYVIAWMPLPEPFKEEETE